MVAWAINCEATTPAHLKSKVRLRLAVCFAQESCASALPIRSSAIRAVIIFVIAGSLVVWVFHSRHVLHARHLRPLSALYPTHHFVVLIWRENSNKGHHALHEPAPTWTKGVIRRLCDHLIHRHHWAFHVRVLGKTGDVICIGCDITFRRAHLDALRSSFLHALHILFRVLLTNRTIAPRKVVRRTNPHTASE